MSLTSGITGQHFTLHALVKLLDSGTRTIIGGPTNSLVYRINALKQELVKAGVVIIGASTTALSTSGFQKINVRWDGTTATFRLGGVADGAVSNAQTFSANITGIGTNMSTLTNFWRDDVCVIKGYQGVQTLAEVQAEEAAILSKWGV